MSICGRRRDSQLRSKNYKLPKIDLKRVNFQQMRTIPETEEDLIPVAVHINMRSRIIVDDMIRWTEI